MGDHVLVAYATKHGSTEEVARAVAATIGEWSTRADLCPAGKIGDVSDYGLVVLGAPLYSGRWHRDAHRFLRKHRDALSKLPVAVFALGPRSPREEGNWPRCQEQLDRALTKHGWLEPVGVELFGGVDPPKRNREPRDQREWDAIKAWATSLRRSPS